MSTVVIGKSGKGVDSLTPATTLSDLESKGTFVIEKEVKDEAPVAPLCDATIEKKFWFQRQKGFDPDTVATMVIDWFTSLRRSSVLTAYRGLSLTTQRRPNNISPSQTGRIFIASIPALGGPGVKKIRLSVRSTGR